MTKLVFTAIDFFLVHPYLKPHRFQGHLVGSYSLYEYNDDVRDTYFILVCLLCSIQCQERQHLVMVTTLLISTDAQPTVEMHSLKL